MPSEGREPAKMNAMLDELAASAKLEPPMSDGDATGHVPQDRYKRHLAMQAWRLVRDHDPAQPLPVWVLDYLKDVAARIEHETGPQGALSREGASIALGIDGKAWMEHSPINVYFAMQEWIDDKELREIEGPKSAAARYIEVRMNGDRDANVDTLVRKYKEGKRIWLSEE